MIYVGIDVSKDKLDVCFNSIQKNMPKKDKFATFPNTVEGIEKLCMRLTEEHFVVFESTGPYSKLLHKILCNKGIKRSCVNPYYAAQYLRSTKKKAKTDSIDCEGLSIYGHKTEPEQTHFGTDANVKLNEMVKARDVLVRDIRSYKNRLEVPYESDHVNELYGNVISYLTKKLEDLEEDIKSFIKENKEHSDKVKRLTTIKGVGFISAVGLLALCPELGTLSSKQAASLAGVAPNTRESGSTYMPSHIYGGRSALRRLLYNIAMVAIRWDPELRELYENLRRSGKEFKVAITAIMRRIIIRANSILKRGVDYQVRGTITTKIKSQDDKDFLEKNKKTTSKYKRIL